MSASTRARLFALTFLAPLLVAVALSFPWVVHGPTTRTVVDEAGDRAPDPTAVPTPTDPPAPTATSTPAVVVAAAMVSENPLFVVRARKGGPAVRVAPNDQADELSGLYYDTYLPVYSLQTDPTGSVWYQVRLWGTLTGWIRADETEPGDPPTPTPRPPVPPSTVPRPGRSDVIPLTAKGVTTDWVNFRTGSSVDSDPIDLLAPDTALTVHAWQTDDEGSAWYEVSVNGRKGWVWSGAADLITPNPSSVAIGGKPIWSSITGKGMWMPVPLMEMANPDAVVSAAHDLGLTHIYLEVGASGRGFYGREQVDRLLPVAHHDGIKVIGWVLTGLNDLPSDVSLCTTIGRYRTPSGDQLDGIAPDIEDNMGAVDVSAFSQILRAQLGSDRLIVGVIFPAGTWIGRQHPVARILSQSFNALAPMAYWHESRQAYSSDAVAEFIRHAVVDIHAAVDDPHYPVAVIGQTYDSFSRNGAGPNNPTGEEIAVALEAAKQDGAVGVSLFQWGTTTPAEWDALRRFSWSSGSTH